MDKATLIIEDTKDALEDIENKTREVCSQENIGLIIINYLQYIEIKKDKFKIIYDIKEIDKYNKFNFEKLKRLKVLACEFNVPIICLYHLHQKLEERQDKHPQLSDFLEQTCIEENSDTIIFLRIIINNRNIRCNFIIIVTRFELRSIFFNLRS